jgi:hypothetical protein
MPDSLLCGQPFMILCGSEPWTKETPVCKETHQVIAVFTMLSVTLNAVPIMRLFFITQVVSRLSAIHKPDRNRALRRKVGFMKC